jgi:hypothetical protein
MLARWERHGNAVFLLQQALIPALKEKSGGRGFGFLCNLSPLEMDANAAAGRFAWDRHHDALTDVLEANAVSPSHEGLLRYRGGPEAIDTLPERMIAFAHLFAERCERLARAEGGSYADKLDECWPGRGSRVWERLMNLGT